MYLIEAGFFTLILAFFIAVFQLVLAFISRKDIGALDHLVLNKGATAAQFICIFVSFLILTYGYIASDFSVLNIADNSHTAKPLIYKITGVWGNHEGSMLLWVLILTLYGFAMALSKSFNAAEALRYKALNVQAGITAMILAFIILTSNPFERLYPVPDNGNGLNPILQDIGLALHPPLLYGGYVGLSAVFAVACAALWQGEFDRNIGRIIRIWCLIAWSSLTLGIGLGMWWAYYELGWGGFWFWDPVENASLLPWLAATALIHSAVIVEKRNIFKSWTVLLAISAFGFSMLGTFIVRSGLLTSVHSFASSPTRGVIILIIMAITVGGALLLYAYRSHLLREEPHYHIFSRESALLLNNYLICGILLIVLTGTLYPTILEVISGSQISVGAPYYNDAIAPLIYAIAVICPLASFVRWKQHQAVVALFRKIGLLIGITAILGVSVWIFRSQIIPSSAFILILLSLWIIVVTISDFTVRGGLKRPIAILREDIGKFGAHLAIGFLMIGVAGAGIMQEERTFMMSAGTTEQIGDERFRFLKSEIYRIENYISDKAYIKHENTDRIYQPERRFFPVARQTTTEADIHLSFWRDIYITIGEQNKEGQRLINIRLHPLVGFMWFAIMLAAVAGCVKAVLLLRKTSGLSEQ
ncbi:MAG: heme lyase CcmF/NrfE family subunit [Pseudomonadota bacterium]